MIGNNLRGPMQDSTDITHLSVTTLVLLFIVLPASLLLILILLSYAFSPWA